MTTHLANYAYFNNKQDMDKAVRQHIMSNWGDMNNTDRAVLDMIRRDSVTYGAAHLRHSTIEKEIEKSNATVRRTLRKLEQLGIIERIHYIRPIMSGLGANIYAIKPYHDQSEMITPADPEKPGSDKVRPSNPTTASSRYK